MLDAGPRDAYRVDFLECVAADGVTRYLAGQHDHRDRIHVRGSDAGNGIGCTGSRGDEADAGLAGGARVTVGSVSSSLFMAHQDMHDIVLFLQSIVNM